MDSLTYHASETVVIVAIFLGFFLTAHIALLAWRDWIALQRLEAMQMKEQQRPYIDSNDASSMIELADLKERIRKLEAIASGVEY